MQPIIRLTDYIEEYKRLVYDYYAKVNNIVYSTYYQLNHIDTVYDPHYLQTFHKTGENSGRKYNKIHMLPVTTVQQVLPALDGFERGVTSAYNTLTSFTIDSSTYVTPHVGDIMVFEIQGDYAIWEVVNVEMSGPLDKPYYRCNVRQHKTRDGFEDQVSHEYMYVEYNKRVYDMQRATNFIYLMNRLTELVHFLNSKDCYNHNLAYHTHNKMCFPELENILDTLDSMTPLGTLFMSHFYNEIDINMQSIWSLLCLPKVFDVTKPLITTFDRPTKAINPRTSVYINYQEYVTTENGLDILNNVFEAPVIERATMLLDYLQHKDTFLDTYVKPDDTVLTNLIDEIIQFIHTGVETYVSENKTATNLLEAVIEYCLVSNKLLSIHANGAVILP